jgi:2'-hydroxyisoflavone reductase
VKLLILGGTIFLGRHLVEAARARGHEVTLFHRGEHGADLYPEIERLRGDRDGDLRALRGRRWDVVIDTSGYVPRVVRASAQLLADAVERYVFISSISVYADFRTPGMDESAPVGTLTEEQLREAESIRLGNGVRARAYGVMYGPLKALCERAAEEIMPGRALNIRPGLIVGPYDYSDRFTYWVRRIAQGGEVLAPGRPERAIELIDVRDLAEWTLRMAEGRRTGVYNATGPDYSLAMGQFLDECRAVSGSDAHFVWVSEQFLLAAGVAPWSEVPLWIPESDPDAAGFSRINCDKAIAAGLTFRPLAATIRNTLAWDAARSPGEERRAGLAPEREAQLLREWRAAPGA